MIGRLGNGHRRWPHCRRWCIHQGVKVDDTQSPYTTPICLTLPVLSCWPHPCTSHTNRFTMCIVNIHALLMVRDRLHRWALFCFACECCRWRDMRRVEYIQRYLSQDALDRQNGNWMKRPDLISLWRRHVLSNVTPQCPQLGYFDPEKMCVVLYRSSEFCSLLGSWDPTKSFIEDMKRPFFLAFCSKQ